MAEFFAAIGLQKAIGAGCLTPSKDQIDSSLTIASFPSLAFWMKINHDFVQ